MIKKLTTSVAKLAPLFAFLKKNGVNLHELLSSMGIDPLIMQSPDSRLPFNTVHILTKEAVRITNDENLGLHVGEIITGLPNILGYILMNYSTIGEVIEKYCTYQKIVDEGRCIKLQIKDSHALIEVVITDDNLAEERHLIDCCLAGFLTYYKQLMRKKTEMYDLIEARFVYDAPADISEYRRIFPCKLIFKSSMNALVINRSALDIHIPAANRELLALFEDYAAGLLVKVTESDSLANRARRLIIKHLRGETPTIEEIAGKLVMSVRSLQLKLKEEGTTFSAILDEIRRDLAIQYLRDNKTSIAEISYLLGFSEPSVFHRSFKKWTNSTPAKFRINA